MKPTYEKLEELKAEVARLREDSTWKRVEEAEGLYIEMRDERDALRVKMEKVRNVCRRAIVNDRTSQEHDAELAERVDEIQDIVEDEGDDEA